MLNTFHRYFRRNIQNTIVHCNDDEFLYFCNENSNKIE